MSWASTELRHADLGDQRLNRRLASLVDAFTYRAEASIPQALPSWAQTKAAYRFCDNDRVTPAAILDAHVQATRARVAKQVEFHQTERTDTYRRILAVQDTTDLNYTGHAATQGLGYLQGQKLSGFFLHSTLAVTTSGEPLGLLGHQMWARPHEAYGKKHERGKTSLEQKESVRWLQAEAASWKALPPHVEVVMVADREADIYALFAQARPGQQQHVRAQWIVRAAQDRRTQTGKLFEALSRRPVAGHLTAEVAGRRDEPPRRAQLAVRYGTVCLLPPKNQPHLPALEVTGVVAEELAPPPGCEPICWRLLTSLPVESLEEACEVVRYYSLRWLIERFHYVLKSGCHVEELQLQRRERLERAVAIFSVVAWRLLELTYAARLRPSASSAEVLAEHEWQALAAQAYHAVPEEALTLQEAVRLIAMLGGFLGRRRDGAPGVKVLWRGLRRLHDIAETWKLAQSLSPPSSPLVGKA